MPKGGNNPRIQSNIFKYWHMSFLLSFRFLSDKTVHKYISSLCLENSRLLLTSKSAHVASTAWCSTILVQTQKSAYQQKAPRSPWTIQFEPSLQPLEVQAFKKQFFFYQTLNNSHAITNRPALTKPLLNAVQ